MHTFVEAWEESPTQSFEGMVEEGIKRTFEGTNEGTKDYGITKQSMLSDVALFFM
jgi:hypothetical protein